MTRSALIVLGAACLAGMAAVALYLLDPATAAIFPPCPFHALTGLHCPGCGSLRAFHALVRGEWLAALRLNPLTTLSMPLLVVGAGREVSRLAGVARPRRTPAPPWAVWLLLVVLVTFGVLRNLPAFGFLAPA